ncbi:hypothetical protein K2173_008458 [Erythroxylum novogranatense]|uniref:Secreted protein n=1 Tax=Erythroxylum novogranatense TaxID=1862640 RepID=A0AAV8S563_9ROSI|nr:hypothetical protein K2173_008458 [Erythroxylum novogranatense]
MFLFLFSYFLSRSFPCYCTNSTPFEFHSISEQLGLFLLRLLKLSSSTLTFIDFTYLLLLFQYLARRESRLISESTGSMIISRR